MNITNVIITAFFLLLPFLGHSQSGEVPVINVTGKSRVLVEPTRTTVSFHLDEHRQDYAEAIRQLSKRTSQLKKSLNDLKFDDNEINTSNFSITKYTYFDRKIGNQRDSGFVAIQTISVKFGMNTQRLIKILNETGDSKANAEIEISFSVSDDEMSEIESELIKGATKDARQKAEIIAKEAGIKIVGIKEIIYEPGPSGWTIYPPTTAQRRLKQELEVFSPEDLSVSKYVKIIFMIQNP